MSHTLAAKRSSTGAVVSLGDILLTPCAHLKNTHLSILNWETSTIRPRRHWPRGAFWSQRAQTLDFLNSPSPLSMHFLQVLGIAKTILSSPSRTLSPGSKKVSNGFLGLNAMSSVAWGNSYPPSFPTSYVYFTWSQYNFAPILITQRFAWCTSVGFINGCETSKTKVWLSEQDTLLNAPYTLYIFFETIQLYVHTVTQVQ